MQTDFVRLTAEVQTALAHQHAASAAARGPPSDPAASPHIVFASRFPSSCVARRPFFFASRFPFNCVARHLVFASRFPSSCVARRPFFASRSASAASRCSPAQSGPPRGFDSRIVSSLPPLFQEFRGKRFALLWRGSRDGFGARDFHGRCYGRANTLTLILGTGGNVFGGFTPLECQSRVPKTKSDSSNGFKCDKSLESFLFTLKNTHSIPARKFALMVQNKVFAICCDSSFGPVFGGMGVRGNCNAKTRSWTCLSTTHTNDTGPKGNTVFTGSYNFQVREIEVFEITG
jgi:hypothetical protein